MRLLLGGADDQPMQTIIKWTGHFQVWLKGNIVSVLSLTIEMYKSVTRFKSSYFHMDSLVIFIALQKFKVCTLWCSWFENTTCLTIYKLMIKLLIVAEGFKSSLLRHLQFWKWCGISTNHDTYEGQNILWKVSCQKLVNLRSLTSQPRFV